MGVLNLILLQPILNILLVLTNILFSNFGLGVIALTILVRLVLLPLTLMQLRSSKKTTEAMNADQAKAGAVEEEVCQEPAEAAAGDDEALQGGWHQSPRMLVLTHASVNGHPIADLHRPLPSHNPGSGSNTSGLSRSVSESLFLGIGNSGAASIRSFPVAQSGQQRSLLRTSCPGWGDPVGVTEDDHSTRYRSAATVHEQHDADHDATDDGLHNPDASIRTGDCTSWCLVLSPW